MQRTIYTEDHELFRMAARGFIDGEIVPNHDEWERVGLVDREMIRRAGAQGLLGMAISRDLGGGGVDDFRFNAVIGEEIMRAGVFGSGLSITLHNDVCLPYFLRLADDQQRRRWFPGMANGDLLTAIAMTEPGAGSDLAGIQTTAVRDGDHYIVNGSKTFITNGINSELVITAVKTDPSQRHSGMSLLVIEEGMEGFTRGRNLDKIGLHAQDTAELFFSDVPVPAANLLGEEGRGFFYLVENLPQERMSLAVGALAHAEAAFEWTLDYVKDRKAFGSTIGAFQVVKHRMAEMRTELDVARTFIDRLVMSLVAGDLSPEDAAKAKWWVTELEQRVIDRCLQLFGGWGYMEEYPIARAFRDARVQTIYGGTTEIMKEIIGRGLGL